MDLTDPQQWNGYTYANNNPTTYSDPSGLIPDDCAQVIGGCGAYAPGSENANRGAKKNNPCYPINCHQKLKPANGDDDGWTETLGRRKAPPRGRMTPELAAQILLGTHITNTIAGSARWNAFCYNFPIECGDMEEAALAAIDTLFNDLVGITDAKECVGGSVSGCVWTALGIIPLGKLKAAGRLGELLLDSARAACSFSGETHVLMADGTTKPISELKPGDKVLATDPETGEQGPREITDTFVHDDYLIDLVLANGDTVTTTEDHPFWNTTDRQWQRADELTGDTVLRPDGRHERVLGTRPGPAKPAPAHNLTVDDLHTYYVVAGTTPVLVHNQGGMGGCSDAAHQGVLHIRDEIAKEGAGGSHSWAARMSDDELADYLDGFVTRGGGQELKDGAIGWYDPDRGIAVIQRGEYSMTGYKMSYDSFLGKLK
jgi:hypothetical protein